MSSQCRSSRTRSLSLIGCVLVLALGFSSHAFGQVPLAQHVILVIEENTSYSHITQSSMPWLWNEATTGGSYAGSYYSDIGGSLMDYLYLASGSCESHYTNGPACNLPPGGSNFYCNGNNCYFPNTTNKDPITDQNIFTLMNTQPLSWKVYVQNYLNAGGTVNVPDFNTSGQPPNTHYYARHNAAVWYADVLNNVLGSQGNIVDFEQFNVDVANNTLPRYAIIVPDGCWDLHDTGCSSLAAADNFLNSNLTPMLSLSDFQSGGSGLLLVTWDNADGDGVGQVFTALIGPNVKKGYVSSTSYKHENALRTILEALGITTYPGWSNTAADMSDFFSSSAGSVVVNSPPNNSVQGSSVLVNAAASELGATIDHMDVWDSYNGVSTKLGNVFATTINQAFTVSGNGAHQMTVEDIGGPPNYPVLHKEITNYTVTSNYGVFVNTPANNSTQAPLFPLSAYAVESTAPESSSGIDHLEVWNSGTKLGDSPHGTTLNQWYSLSPGSYTLSVEDVTKSVQTIHKSTVAITVSGTLGVYVNSPASNSTWPTTTIPINAYAYEQSGSSTPLVDHIEVWDNTHGQKLAQSVTGTGLNSAYMNQSVTLQYGPGTYQLAISDINPNNNYQPIHTTYVTVTVQ